MFRIVHKRQLSDAVFEIGVEAPKIAAKAHAPGKRLERLTLFPRDVLIV